MMGCVYLLTSPSGKFYVGMTMRDDVAIRWDQHRRLRNDRPLSRAVQKYGWENFRKEILFESDDCRALNAKEMELVALYGCVTPNGYNCTAGGDGVAGRKRTHAEKAAISAALRGRRHSDETRAKLRAAHARGGPRNSFTGRTHTDETRRLMSEKKIRQASLRIAAARHANG